MRVARGACWAISLALLGGFVLTILDVVAELPGWARGVGLAAWLTGFGVLIWRLVIRRWQLRWARNPVQAAKAELPGNLQAAATAALALTVSLLAAFMLPNASAHICRVALPWYRQPGAKFRVVVTSGELVARTGGVVNFSAYLEKLDPGAVAPENAVVDCRDALGNVTRLVMDRDATGAYHAASPPVAGDFSYRVEAAGSSSDWLPVIAIEPALPTDSTILEVTPPAYAREHLPTQTLYGFPPFTALQYSTVELSLSLSRPAAHAFLKWEPAGGPAEVITIPLTSDGRTGNASLLLKQDGVLRLTTGAERNGKTLSSTISIKVRVDADSQPRFERVKGVSPFPLSIQPDQPLVIEFSAVDDIAVSSAILEYSIANGDAMRATVPIALTRTGPRTVQGRLDFDLPGKLREGETLRYRLAATDSRRLSEPELGPQSVAYPESGWASVTVRATARPVDEQEVENRRLLVHQELAKAAALLRELQTGVASLRSDAGARFELDHEIRLEKLRKTHDGVVRLLRNLAREPTLSADFHPLALQFQDVVDHTLQVAGENLRLAWTDKAVARADAFSQSIAQYTLAVDSLPKLSESSDRLAAAQIDCLRLQSLKSELLAFTKHVQTEASAPREVLLRRQRGLNERLARVIEESTPLREAVARARRESLVGLSRKLTALANNIRDLDDASQELDRDVRATILRAIAADCETAASAAVDLLAKLEQPARVAGVSLPRSEAVNQAAVLVAGGKTVEALTRLQQLLEAFKVVAVPFDKWADERTNPKQACHQIALWQEDLRKRYREMAGENGQAFKALPPGEKERLQTEQAAIKNAVRDLKLPPNAELTSTLNAVVKQLAALCERLEKPVEGTEAAMTSAVIALNQLADKIPSIPERLALALDEFDKLQRKQDGILKSIEELVGKPDVSIPGTVPALAARLKPAMTRQHEQLAAFSALDLPGEEIRRARIIAALTDAEADLDSGSPYDIFASQHRVRREFERLKLVLRRSVPPEESLEQLTSRLEAMLKAIDAEAGRARDPFAANGDNVQEIHRQLSLIVQVIPEAAALRAEALDAVRAVADPDRRIKLKLAIESVRKLAERIRGNESELERIQRFAAARQSAAEKAAQKLGSPTNRPESAESQAQLAHEADELLYTRVGLANQVLKQRVLAKYGQLKQLSEPDRNPVLQNELAETLNEMAALMADLPDLALPFPTPTTRQKSHVLDRYLPSNEASAQLLYLAARFQRTRERLNHLAEEELARSSPAQASPFEQLENSQRELVGDVARFVERLEREGAVPDQVRTAAMTAGQTADQLANGRARPAQDSAAAAAQGLRSLSQFTGANELAVRQEQIASRVSALIGEYAGAAAQQKLRSEELLHRTQKLLRELQRGIREKPEVRPQLVAAEKATASAAKLLADAAIQSEMGQRRDAEKCRGSAVRLLAGQAEKLAKALPDVPDGGNPAVVSCVQLLQAAAADMDEAKELLAANKRADVAKVLQKTALALEAAIKSRLESAK
jgi:hypothetical protein